MTNQRISNDEKKRLRGIGHHLEPVVMIGEKGLSEGVIAEVDRALTDHELIKIKVNGEREERQAMIQALIEHTQAVAIQIIGKTVLLLRKNPKGSGADPKLSNLKRFAE